MGHKNIINIKIRSQNIDFDTYFWDFLRTSSMLILYQVGCVHVDRNIFVYEVKVFFCQKVINLNYKLTNLINIQPVLT